MAGERAWVEAVKAALEGGLAGPGLVVETRWRLPYAVHVTGYRRRRGGTNLTEPVISSPAYQTDLLIAETLKESGTLVPRVVVEFKLGAVSTHDALTYSAKAGTHKDIHPYLRYGIVIGNYQGPIPHRLIRHGQQFDFMLTLASETLTDRDRRRLIRVLKDEVEASRTMNKLLLEKSDIWLLHRKLAVKSE